MTESKTVVDAEALRRIEAVYRARLLSDPCDVLARGCLAWCLFLQSLHRAGEERMLDRLRGFHSAAGKALAIPRPAGPEAQELLNECLRQTETVLHLSEPGEPRLEMERLLGLARLSAGSQAFHSAEENAHRILEDLIRDLSDRDDSLSG